MVCFYDCCMQYTTNQPMSSLSPTVVQHRSYWWFVVYYVPQSQSIIGVSGVSSRVIGRMGQCEECMHLSKD